jgi:hypothetical protein
MDFTYALILLPIALGIQYSINETFTASNDNLNKIIVFSFLGSPVTYFFTNYNEYGQKCKINFQLMSVMLDGVSTFIILCTTLILGTTVASLRIFFAIGLILLSSIGIGFLTKNINEHDQIEIQMKNLINYKMTNKPDSTNNDSATYNRLHGYIETQNI